MQQRLVLSILLTACAADAPEETSRTESAVLGGVTYTNCTPAQLSFVDRARSYARIASVSRAFEQCVEEGSINGIEANPGFWVGPYRQCVGDPFYGQSLTKQIRRALDAARSPNGLSISCTGGGGNASAAIGGYGDTDDEGLAFSGWLGAAMTDPPSGAWPMSQTAETIWHEAMHQHGYTHGANDQEPAIAACGYTGDPTWNFQTNTMPYLLGGCMSGVMSQSYAACGAIEGCGAGMLRLVDGWGSRTCECVADPTQNNWRLAYGYTHVTTAANTSGSSTTIDYPLLNGHPNVVLQVTHSFATPDRSTGAYNTAPIQAVYNATTARWTIQNTGGATMSPGTAFFVRLNRGTIHRTTTSSILGHYSLIDHPLANGNPYALVTVSRMPFADGSTATDPHPIGVFYSGTYRKWAVFNQDYAAMPVDTAFSVDVETAQHHGLHFIHAVNDSNRSDYLTRLSSPLLDNNPNARLLVTADWSRGSVYDTHPFSVWYDGARWWIYHDDFAPMTNGLAFHVEVLRDEMQHFVPVAENVTITDTFVDVAPTDRVRVSGAGMMQPASGLPSNDADGTTPVSGAPFPLAANAYSLIGRFGLGAEPYFPIGRDAWPAPPPSTRRLYLRPNDYIVGNGSGAYMAEVRMFR
jgi:hypothetical protein